MKLEIHHYHHFETCDHAELLRGVQLIVTNSEKKIMAKFEESVATLNEKLGAVETRLSNIGGDVTTLKDEIASLKSQLGELTPEQQSAMDAVIARVDNIANQAGTIDDSTPPAGEPA